MGARCTFGIGAPPLIAQLHQHVVPPQPRQLFSIRVQGSPPESPFSCSLFPFAAALHKLSASQQATTEMDWCRVVGPRPVPASRREARFPTNNLPLTPCEVGSKCKHLGPAQDPWNLSARPPWRHPTRPPATTPKNHRFGLDGRGFGVFILTGWLTPGLCESWPSHFRSRIPGGFTLPHRSDETLGRETRSKPRAPVPSAGLSAVSGLGSRFRMGSSLSSGPFRVPERDL